MFKTLCFCLAVSLAACSTTGTRAPATARTAVAACPPNTTASRIQRPNECSASPIRTYSQEDVQRTGQPDVGNALQMLDPSISVHH
jgi:hypothetical protein